VLDGFTTIELAERDYGVMIDPQTMTLDLATTERVREQRTSSVPV
jgi:5-oxoprolinase (ATP-hydrolysing)